MKNKTRETKSTKELRVDVDSVDYSLFTMVCKEKNTSVTEKVNELIHDYIEREL